MAADKVSFSSDGEWHFGDKLTTMDMQRNAGRSSVMSAQPRPPRERSNDTMAGTTTGTGAASTGGTVTPTQSATGAFDLGAIRKKAKRVSAAKSAATENTPVSAAEDAAMTPTAESVAPPPKATRKRAAKTDPASAQPELADATAAPTVEEAAPTPVEEKATLTPSADFKKIDELKSSAESEAPAAPPMGGGLSEMKLDKVTERKTPDVGDSIPSVKETAPAASAEPAAVEAEQAPSAESVPTVDVTPIVATVEEAPAPTPVSEPIHVEVAPEVTPAEEPTPAVEPVMVEPVMEPTSTVEPVTSVTPAVEPVQAMELQGVQRADDNVDQGHFDVVPAGDLLADGNAIEDTPAYMKEWLMRVIDAKVRNPTTVFDCKDCAGLRAYYVLQDEKRSGNICIALGCGNRVSAVSYSTRTKKLVDIAAEVSVQGTLALIQDSVAAIYGQRCERAITV